MDSLIEDAACVEPLAVLSRLRRDFHACLTARADELSELADAVLCADGPVKTLAGLSLAPEHGRGKGQAQMIPGWPYSVIAALEPGRTSWTAVLDAIRLGPDDDQIAVTAAQVRDVITRLIAAGHWREGDPRILVIFDAGYDVTRLAHLLADLPARVLGRLRSD